MQVKQIFAENLSCRTSRHHRLHQALCLLETADVPSANMFRYIYVQQISAFCLHCSSFHLAAGDHAISLQRPLGIQICFEVKGQFIFSRELPTALLGCKVLMPQGLRRANARDSNAAQCCIAAAFSFTQFLFHLMQRLLQLGDGWSGQAFCNAGCPTTYLL